MFSKKCFVSILCLLMFMTSINATGQTQRQQPKTPQLPAMQDGQKQLETKAHTSRTTTGNLPNVTSTYVSVSMQANWGPFGAAYAPPDTAQLVGVKEAERAVNQTYRFPSIYFNISAAPVIVPIIKDEESPEQISQVMFDDRDMEWMDVSIELEPILAQRQSGTAENDIGGKVVNKKDWEKYVQILEMLPNDTHSVALWFPSYRKSRSRASPRQPLRLVFYFAIYFRRNQLPIVMPLLNHPAVSVGTFARTRVGGKAYHS
jgi:hypothetical protein